MSNTIGEFITQEKKSLLEAELGELSGVKRREVLKNLEYAKGLGDLSENAEYHQARDEQGRLEDRIAHIQKILKESVVVERHKSDSVEVGSKATVEKDGKEKIIFRIVGSEEADMAQGKISNHSPLGIALMGKRPGDEVSLKTPKGISKYKIVSID